MATKNTPIEVMYNADGQRFFYGTYTHLADAKRDARVLRASGRRIRVETTDGGHEVSMLTGDGWVSAYGWLTV